MFLLGDPRPLLLQPLLFQLDASLLLLAFLTFHSFHLQLVFFKLALPFFQALLLGQIQLIGLPSRILMSFDVLFLLLRRGCLASFLQVCHLHTMQILRHLVPGLELDLHLTLDVFDYERSDSLVLVFAPQFL